MPRSGDGFVTLADGTVRWGRFGAAGVLVRCGGAGRDVGDDGDGAGGWWYFLARRSEWCHQGGCWAIPGGALDEGEPPVEGALREFAEEVGEALGDGDYRVVHVHEDDHGGWSYWTVVIDVAERFDPPERLNWETAETGWVRHDELGELELHTAFRRTLARLGLLVEGGQ